MSTELTDPREVTMRAAALYDDLRNKINDQERQIHNATLVVEGRNVRIAELERALEEAYLRITQLQDDRDLAVNERDEMRLIFYSFKTQLDSLVIPLEPPPTRRKRNGRAKSVEVEEVTFQTIPVDEAPK